MAKPKKKYSVYATPYLEAEELENCVQYPREFMGETWAVSEAQAINNVRYRTVGNTSQYLPYITSGHWEKGIEWEAELDEQGE